MLTLWARGHITERLPWEILESICDHCEEEVVVDEEEILKEESDRYFASHPVPQPQYEADLATIGLPSDCHARSRIPLAKYEKNRFVFSMSHVCRSWRLHLIESKRLWRDIAFSTDTRPIGVRLATFFLARVADSEIPLHIYAGLPFGDVENPAIGALLANSCSPRNVFLCVTNHSEDTYFACWNLHIYLCLEQI